MYSAMIVLLQNWDLLFKMRLLGIIFLIFFFVGCASMNTPPDTLVMPWSEELSSGEAPLPFLAKYARDEKAIYYLAAQHSNNGSDPTYRMMNEYSKKFPAQLFLIEGFETEKGYSPQEIKEWAISDGVNGKFSGGEAAYAVQIALRKKVPFIGLEPSEKEILSALEKQKFTAQDIANYYFIRQLPQWKRAGTFDVGKIRSTYASFVKGVAAKFETEVNTDYEDFLKWYKAKNKEAFSPTTYDSETAAPLSNGKYYTQKLAAIVGMVRDRHMVRLIENERHSKNFLFIVVGGSHWMTQKLALEAISGFPSFEFKRN